MKKKIQNNILKSSGLTEFLKTKIFKNFNQSKQPELYRVAKEYADNYSVIKNERCNGLAFIGSVGNGKTHLLAAIANKLLKKDILVVFINTPELIAELRAAQFGENLDKKINLIKNAPVVIFDDLAKEKPTDWVRTQYYMIINHRYINNLPVLFSSNCTFEELEDRLGEATTSRLMAMTKDRLVMCNGEDYRIKE